VIAETADLPTKFAKTVVTDDKWTLRTAAASEGELQGMGARYGSWIPYPCRLLPETSST